MKSATSSFTWRTAWVAVRPSMAASPSPAKIDHPISMRVTIPSALIRRHVRKIPALLEKRTPQLFWRTSPVPLAVCNALSPDAEREGQAGKADPVITENGPQYKKRERATQRNSDPRHNPTQSGRPFRQSGIFKVDTHGRARSCSMRSLRYRVKGTPFSAALAFIASSRLSASRMFSTADFGSNSKLDGLRHFSARRLRSTDRTLDRISAMSSRSPTPDARGGYAVSLWPALADCIYKRNVFRRLRSAGICFRLGGVCP